MEIPQLADCFRSYQRRISRQYDDVVIAVQCFARDHERMARSALWFLQHEIDIEVSHRRPHALRFMPDDSVDILCRNNLQGGADHMRQQRLSPDLMQHLGKLRLQSGSLARGHDGHRDAWNFTLYAQNSWGRETAFRFLHSTSI